MPKASISQTMLAALNEAQQRINYPEHEREKAILDYLETFEKVLKKAWKTINSRSKSERITLIDIAIEMLTTKADLHLVLSGFSEERQNYEEAFRHCETSSENLIEASEKLLKTAGLLNKKIHQENIDLIQKNYASHLRNVYTESLISQTNGTQLKSLNFINTLNEKFKRTLSKTSTNPVESQEAIGDFFYDVYESLADDDVDISVEGYIKLLDTAEKGYAEALKLVSRSPKTATLRQSLFKSIFNVHFYKFQCYLENEKVHELSNHANLALKYIEQVNLVHVFDDSEVHAHEEYVTIYQQHLESTLEIQKPTTQIPVPVASSKVVPDTEHNPKDEPLEKLLQFSKEHILGYGAGQNDIAKVALIFARIFRNADNLLSTLLQQDPNLFNTNKRLQYKLVYISYELYIKASKLATDDRLINEIQRCLDFMWRSYSHDVFLEFRKADFQVSFKEKVKNFDHLECEQEMTGLIGFAVRGLRQTLGEQALDNQVDNMSAHIFEQYKPYRDSNRKMRFSEMNRMANLDDPFCLGLAKTYLPTLNNKERHSSIASSLGAPHTDQAAKIKRDKIKGQKIKRQKNRSLP